MPISMDRRTHGKRKIIDSHRPAADSLCFIDEDQGAIIGNQDRLTRYDALRLNTIGGRAGSLAATL